MTDDELRNGLRRVITNDLGISRAYIDSQIEELLQEQVDKALKKYLTKDTFKDQLKERVDNILSRGRWYANGNLEKEVSNQISSLIAERLEISLKDNLGGSDDQA